MHCLNYPSSLREPFMISSVCEKCLLLFWIGFIFSTSAFSTWSEMVLARYRMGSFRWQNRFSDLRRVRQVCTNHAFNSQIILPQHFPQGETSAAIDSIRNRNHCSCL